MDWSSYLGGNSGLGGGSGASGAPASSASSSIAFGDAGSSSKNLLPLILGLGAATLVLIVLLIRK